jgi:hypothetical protein
MGTRRRDTLESRLYVPPERFDWSYKAVAAPRNGRYIPRAGLPLTQRSSKCRNVDFEIALFHNDVGPRSSHELAFGNKLARTLEQCGQNLEGTTAETNGPFSGQ